METRRATSEDTLDVLAWRNDPIAVAMSKSGSVDRDEHIAWFSRAITDPNRVLLIAQEGAQKLGMVRFDRTGDGWLVSITVAPAMRSRGYGSAILRDAVAKIGQGKLVAEIKVDNLASVRIFERCGFRQIGKEDGLLHFVRP